MVDLLFNGGTVGWCIALYNTCTEQGCPELLQYYNDMDWYDADEFCCNMADFIIANYKFTKRMAA